MKIAVDGAGVDFTSAGIVQTAVPGDVLNVKPVIGIARTNCEEVHLTSLCSRGSFPDRTRGSRLVLCGIAFTGSAGTRCL